MKHLDLFSGIGGFALAAEWVFGEVEHTFCDNDPFCQAVLKKHWPSSKIYGDIKDIQEEQADILTGGFPCQPFSQAGRRKGMADDRYLWPEMFRVIQVAKPTWVIAENVSGLVTWNEGMVLEQVCTDLENEGYEVQPFIIPAVAVNAPHRRDRVWIVANSRLVRQTVSQKQTTGGQQYNKNVENSISERSSGRMESSGQVLGGQCTKAQDARPSWESHWPEIAQRLCRMDDGLPARLGGLTGGDYKLYPWWRTQALKAYGNSIVPQVAYQMMKAIERSMG